MKETPYDKEIEELYDKLHDIWEILSPLEQKKAEYLCPFELGDIVVDKRGRKARVDKITVGGLNDGFMMYGTRILKASGKDGLMMGLYKWDKWEKINE